jgi:sugar lactone lactonase YvrE
LNPNWVNLYVANSRNSTVTVYKPGSSEPQQTITQGIKFLHAISFDRTGDLYAASYCSSTHLRDHGWVSVYAPATKSVLRTITKGIACPLALAFDAAGNLYLANVKSICSGAVCSTSYNILVYATGGTSLLRTISLGVNWPQDLAFDSMGNLYVPTIRLRHGKSCCSMVTVYAPGSTSVLRTITQGIFNPGPIAFDAAGNLYVANGGYTPGITVYAPGSVSVLRTIPAGYAGFAQALAFDGAGNLYMAASYGSIPPSCFSVVVYASGTASILRTISQGLCQPTTLVLDNAGNLYVGNDIPRGSSSSRSTTNVLVYAPGSTSVLRKISKGIDDPAQLEFGP